MKLKIKNSQSGITLIEIMVSIAIITLFSAILIADFPKIKASFSLTRSAHRLAQDLRKVQDLSLSGAEYINGSGNKIPIAGYGIYIDKGVVKNKGYKIYADSCKDQKYTPPGTSTCLVGDDDVESIDINAEETGVFIKEFNSTIVGNSVSIDFTPPNPTTTFTDDAGIKTYTSVEIVLGLDSGTQTRSVLINTSGLIEVK